MKISRYSKQTTLIDENDNLFAISKHIDLRMLNGSTYVSTKMQTLKQVAQEVYRSQDAWWILASANNLDPFDNIKPNQVLKCPEILDVLIQMEKQ